MTILIFVTLQCSVLVVMRVVQAGTLRRLMVRGALDGQKVYLIGTPDEFAKLDQDVLLFQFGLSEAHRLTLSHSPENDIADMRRAVADNRRDKSKPFCLVLDWAETARLDRLANELRNSPSPVYLLPTFQTRTLLSNHVHDLQSRSFRLTIQRAPLKWHELAAKRLFDVVLSSIALLLLSPLFLLVILLVKLDSPGPAFFLQQRNGFDQRPFTILKFRSMYVHQDEAHIKQASRDDPRVTRVGRILRKSSIDELPQLLNVLGGSMALVGPRPHAVAHDEHYSPRIEAYCRRHHVKPGITGWAQVNGVRGETTMLEEMEARINLDVWYVNNWTPLLDAVILVRTALEVLRHDAY